MFQVNPIIKENPKYSIARRDNLGCSLLIHVIVLANWNHFNPNIAEGCIKIILEKTRCFQKERKDVATVITYKYRHKLKHSQSFISSCPSIELYNFVISDHVKAELEAGLQTDISNKNVHIVVSALVSNQDYYNNNVNEVYVHNDAHWFTREQFEHMLKVKISNVKPIPMTTLFEWRRLHHIDFLYLDNEGQEVEALLGINLDLYLQWPELVPTDVLLQIVSTKFHQQQKKKKKESVDEETKVTNNFLSTSDNESKYMQYIKFLNDFASNLQHFESAFDKNPRLCENILDFYGLHKKEKSGANTKTKDACWKELPLSKYPIIQVELGGTWVNQQAHSSIWTQRDMASYLHSLGYQLFLIGLHGRKNIHFLFPIHPKAFDGDIYQLKGDGHGHEYYVQGNLLAIHWGFVDSSYALELRGAVQHLISNFELFVANSEE
ncbi:hypothetical protein RFI_31944 [Reticulomyxa filosa]|uniref:Methyltransferase FkbM domain-containing protein n=1 Tax=Reticulomyxa filosa TaxID=46433 RepID=X6LU70_RETFI|nr:hypothetical protein RFI_31944 [Reticulomyxa filosa]|eukprot:ETO05453.1 hypothetical protein RFI_31944 [Reticulomyxa filosa]